MPTSANLSITTLFWPKNVQYVHAQILTHLDGKSYKRFGIPC